MHRLFAIFLLVLLPLQLSWASVAVYCQHESSGQARHLGHHDHQHQASEHQDDTDTNLPAGSDNDCGACHAGCTAAIFGVAQLFLPDHSTDTVDAYPSRWSSLPTVQPERPNWVALA